MLRQLITVPPLFLTHSDDVVPLGWAAVGAALSNENYEFKKAAKESRAIRYLTDKKFSDISVVTQ